MSTSDKYVVVRNAGARGGRGAGGLVAPGGPQMAGGGVSTVTPVRASRGTESSAEGGDPRRPNAKSSSAEAAFGAPGGPTAGSTGAPSPLQSGGETGTKEDPHSRAGGGSAMHAGASDAEVPPPSARSLRSRVAPDPNESDGGLSRSSTAPSVGTGSMRASAMKARTGLDAAASWKRAIKKVKSANLLRANPGGTPRGMGKKTRSNRQIKTTRQLMAEKNERASTNAKELEGIAVSHVANEGRNGIPRFMLRPQEPRRMTWDMIVLFFLLYISVVTPFRIGFTVDAEGALAVFERVIDVFFICDLLVNFRTGYVAGNGAEVYDWKRVGKNYLQTWFAIDFVSSIPFDVLFNELSDVKSAKILKAGRVVKAFRVLRLTKLVRFLKLSAVIERVEENFSINRNVLHLVKLLVGTLMMCHFFACAWFFVGSLEDDVTAQGWVLDQGLWELPTTRRYLVSFYWAVATLATVGYGDVVPVSDAEIVFATFGMLIGGGYFGYIIATMAALVSKLDAGRAKYYEKMDSVVAYAKSRNMPRDLVNRIRRYYKHYLEQKTAFDEPRILSELSSFLREEVAMFLINDTIYSIPLFQNRGPHFVTQLIRVLKPLTCAPGDYVMEAGEVGRDMFTVIHGDLEVLAEDGTLLARLGPGAYFGELAAVGVNGIRMTTVRAVTHCELYSLSRDDLFEAFQEYPDVIEDMRMVAVATYKSLAEKYANQASSRSSSDDGVVPRIDSHNRGDSARALLVGAGRQHGRNSGTAAVGAAAAAGITRTRSAADPKEVRGRRGSLHARRRMASEGSPSVQTTVATAPAPTGLEVSPSSVMPDTVASLHRSAPILAGTPNSDISTPRSLVRVASWHASAPALLPGAAGVEFKIIGHRASDDAEAGDESKSGPNQLPRSPLAPSGSVPPGAARLLPATTLAQQGSPVERFGSRAVDPRRMLSGRAAGQRSASQLTTLSASQATVSDNGSESFIGSIGGDNMLLPGATHSPTSSSAALSPSSALHGSPGTRRHASLDPLPATGVHGRPLDPVGPDAAAGGGPDAAAGVRMADVLGHGAPPAASRTAPSVSVTGHPPSSGSPQRFSFSISGGAGGSRDARRDSAQSTGGRSAGSDDIGLLDSLSIATSRKHSNVSEISTFSTGSSDRRSIPGRRSAERTRRLSGVAGRETGGPPARARPTLVRNGAGGADDPTSHSYSFNHGHGVYVRENVPGISALGAPVMLAGLQHASYLVRSQLSRLELLVEAALSRPDDIASLVAAAGGDGDALVLASSGARSRSRPSAVERPAAVERSPESQDGQSDAEAAVASPPASSTTSPARSPAARRLRAPLQRSLTEGSLTTIPSSHSIRKHSTGSAGAPREPAQPIPPELRQQLAQMYEALESRTHKLGEVLRRL